MNPIITQYKKIVLSLVTVIALGTSAVVLAECKPCAAAAAIKQSIRDAQAAALLEEKPVVKPSKPRRVIELDGMEAQCVCCEYCVKNDCCGASNVRRDAASLAQAAVAALEAATVLVEQIEELDEIPEGQARAAREELTDICPFPNGDDVDSKLQALFNCCVNTNQRIRCQGILAEKCCNKLRHRIHTVKENIGDPDASSLPIPACSVVSSIVDVIDDTDVDVMTWLKSLYVLLFQVYQCTCHPCIEG